MSFHLILTLILGLVFQLAQVGINVPEGEDHCSSEVACGCCDAKDSCPCAAQDDPVQRPAPLAPDASSSLKVPAVRVTDSNFLPALSNQPDPPATIAGRFRGVLTTGYRGVPLRVAFCAHVI